MTGQRIGRLAWAQTPTPRTPVSHPDTCVCAELGVASAPFCPPTDLTGAIAWLDSRISEERRRIAGWDGEMLQAYGESARRAKQRAEGALDGLVQARDWLATGQVYRGDTMMTLTTYCGLNDSSEHEHASDCYVPRNEATERLLDAMWNESDGKGNHLNWSEREAMVLNFERDVRRATVERIRAAAVGPDDKTHDRILFVDDLERILDEEVAR